MEFKLKDLVNIKYGKNQKNVKNPRGEYPILGTGGIMDYADDFLYDKPSVLIGRKGSIGKVKYIEEPFWTIDTLFYTIVNENLVIPKYLYYKLSQIDFNYYNEGTTIPSLRTETLYKIDIDLPKKNIQKKVVNLLNTIDEKIENNQKIIANLQELSQTLFKRWFVDFEFPDENGNPYKSSGGEMIDSELGNIPRDWEVNELGNYVDIIKGLSYKGAFLDKQHERNDSFPLLSISNFNFISGFKSNKTKYYFGDYKERHLVNSGDILIAATDLTQDRKILGAPAIVPNLNKTMIFSLDVFKITETTIPKYVLYFLLQSAKYREFVEGSATGTTVIRIAKNVILKVPIVIDKDISLTFDNLIKPYMEKIEHLSQENQKLTQLRDTLLPKLMSGEIEIPDHIEVNEDELSI
ncbi:MULTISPECIES: restriction endonuclease subunit S [Staphylococcaceae]|uniref:restriction endonuclease subunit S n=1 Tax=Staphylococcaceae TaxID=90964 RepID=UPI001E589D41|nr:restriction endonuclease subunit S [Mammaliicoccus lentus]MCD2478429.1 restriction endonuclease subunit S [Mammaliicoccus lentus]MCD2521467.1 restriction endonuclease subunit S [Mammaliicoccus lentus]MDW4475650.1 restriction endonuclease subunit S [Staphylococcus saprophyticus]